MVPFGFHSGKKRFDEQKQQCQGNDRSLLVPITSTLKVQLALFISSSSADTRTVEFPAGKSLPDAGLTRTVGGFPEFSVMFGSSHVTIARYLPGSVS